MDRLILIYLIFKLSIFKSKYYKGAISATNQIEVNKIMSPLLHIDFVNNSTPEPILCPSCNQVFNLQLAQQEALSTGLSFAHCGQVIFQVVKCHTSNCPARFVLRCKADAPVIDMRELILTPEKTTAANGLEQYYILQQYDSWHDKLKFKYLKAWDEEKFPQKKFIEYYNLLSEMTAFNRASEMFESAPPEQIDNNEYQDEYIPEQYEEPEEYTPDSYEDGDSRQIEEDTTVWEENPYQAWADEIKAEEYSDRVQDELPPQEEYTPDYQPEEPEWVNDDRECLAIDEIEKANKQLLNAIGDSSDPHIAFLN